MLPQTCAYRGRVSMLLHAMQGEGGGGGGGGSATRPAMQQQTVQQLAHWPLPVAGLHMCRVLLPQLHTASPHTRWSSQIHHLRLVWQLSFQWPSIAGHLQSPAKRGGAPTVTAHTAAHRLPQWACATIYDAEGLGTHRGDQSCR